ncbi:unnamed protein product, partial [Mesorhabditis belari]|uniref:Glycosyl transferase CAP10 domain-containing protein n=1 Tax=Mesorhabditis belari TaxID=2138241 RepID=A0AAF3F2L4_9BILA
MLYLLYFQLYFISSIAEGNYDQFTNDLHRKLAKADEFEETPGPANLNYFAKQIFEDLRPFRGGIDQKSVIGAMGYGALYQIFNGSIYRTHACVFSASKNPLENLDILYPAWAFWEGGPAISTYPKGIGDWDETRKKVLSYADRLPWHQKRNQTFFLGSRTSPIRDTLVLLSRKSPDLVDAQFTKNQAYKGPDDTLGYPPAEEKPFEYNCHYKYLVNFRGVAASFRYKHLLLCNSVILNVDGGMLEFFYHKLIPYYHYIPLEVNTEENWRKTIIFLQSHDEIAEKMAKRAQTWIRSKLTNRDVTNYWRKLLSEYTKLLKYEVELDKSLLKIH